VHWPLGNPHDRPVPAASRAAASPGIAEARDHVPVRPGQLAVTDGGEHHPAPARASSVMRLDRRRPHRRGHRLARQPGPLAPGRCWRERVHRPEVLGLNYLDEGHAGFRRSFASELAAFGSPAAPVPT